MLKGCCNLLVVTHGINRKRPVSCPADGGKRTCSTLPADAPDPALRRATGSLESGGFYPRRLPYLRRPGGDCCRCLRASECGRSNLQYSPRSRPCLGERIGAHATVCRIIW